MSRHIADLCPGAQLVMADLSTAMLDETTDVAASRVVADVQQLPFQDDSFDIVVSAWVIETVPQPAQAVSEYLRVLAPGGRVLYTFCSRPDSLKALFSSLLLRTIVRIGFAGHFLSGQETPWHACDSSHRARFRGGLATEISLAKCCTVITTGLDPRSR